MAAVKKVDMTEQCFGESVFTKPPLPSRPASGKFQIRGSGKIFRNTVQNDLLIQTELDSSARTYDTQGSNTADDRLALVIHPTANKAIGSPRQENVKLEPRYRRQTKSAKARVTPSTKNVSKTKKDRLRPFSAGSAVNRRKTAVNELEEKVAVIDLAEKIIPDLFSIERDKLLALPESKHDNGLSNDFQPMHFTRPFSAHFETDANDKCFCKRSVLSKKQANSLKPSVYGLQHNRHIYGSAPDLNVQDKDIEKCPYKLSASGSESATSNNENSTRPVPSTLKPLVPWLNSDVPEEVIGVDAKTCLVFLPSMDWSDIPVVPESQSNDTDLPYKEDITTPKPWKPKKYQHPFFENKVSLDEWVCNHRPSAPEPSDGEWRTIYRKTVKLPRMRTADIVRKEISDLENLLKGVGNQNSDCGIVQYQSEISDFQQALQDTLDMIPDRLKNPEKPVDTFGLKRVCSDHDVLIEEIRNRVYACREELAELELEAGIATDRQYFRKRSNSAL